MKRTFYEVRGFDVMARDGAVGHVRDLVFSTENWRASQVVIDARRWLATRHALVAPQEIALVDLKARCIELKLTRAELRRAPTFEPLSTAAALASSRPAWSRYWITGGAIEPDLATRRFGPLIEVAPAAPPRSEAEVIASSVAAAAIQPTANMLRGFRVETNESRDVGKINDLVVDLLTWGVPYLVMTCGGVFTHRRTLLPTSLISRCDAAARHLTCSVSNDRFVDPPEFIPDELDSVGEGEFLEHFIAPELEAEEAAAQPAPEGERPEGKFHEGHDLRV